MRAVACLSLEVVAHACARLRATVATIPARRLLAATIPDFRSRRCRGEKSRHRARSYSPRTHLPLELLDPKNIWLRNFVGFCIGKDHAH